MKFLFLLISLPVFASVDTTCYETKLSASSLIPSQLCFENITQSSEKLLVVESKSGLLPKNFEITKYSIHNEDKVNFIAQATLVDIWESGCGDGVFAKVTLKGQIVYGEIYPKGLEVAVESEVTYDTCHSPVESESVIYNLVK